MQPRTANPRPTEKFEEGNPTPLALFLDEKGREKGALLTRAACARSRKGIIA